MEDGNRPRKRTSRKLRYFYLGDKPHKVITIVRASDLVVAWSYDDRKRVGYVWSDVKKRMERALKTNEVCDLVGRHRTVINKYIVNGQIKAPKKAYTLDGKFKDYMYLWSPTDIYGLHDYMLTVQKGTRRKDGIVNPGRVPTRAELRAMLEHDTVFYVKTSDGDFSPVWKEHTW